MGVGYLALGANGYVGTPDAADLDLTGDLDLRVEVALDGFGKAQSIGPAKWFGAKAYRLFLDVNNVLTLNLFTTTAATLAMRSTVALNPVELTGTRVWLRATLDADNGAGSRVAKFFRSPDGVTWTQLGATVTQGGAVTLAVSDRPVRLGAHSDTVAGEFASGRYYRAEVRNGIDGPLVASPDFTGLVSGATSYTDAQGHVWTFAGTHTVTPDIPPDTTPPTVSLLTETPGEYDALAGTATLQATASDAVGVSRVEFLVDGVLVGTDEAGTTGEYSVEWDTTTVANGDHVLTARVLDAAGNVSTSAATVKVNNSGWWIVNPAGVPRPASVKIGV